MLLSINQDLLAFVKSVSGSSEDPTLGNATEVLKEAWAKLQTQCTETKTNIKTKAQRLLNKAKADTKVGFEENYYLPTWQVPLVQYQ